MANTKHVSTLELNITSKTAKTFMADLAAQSKAAKDRMKELMAQITEVQAQLTSGKDKDGKVLTSDQILAMNQQVAALQQQHDEAQNLKKTLDTLLKGQITNINQLGKAMDDMSGRTLKQLQQALKEWNQMSLNIGASKNAEDDKLKMMQYAAIIKEIKARTTELKAGFLDLASEATKGLETMNHPLKDIPDIFDAIEGALQKMSSSDLGIYKMEDALQAIADGNYAGSVTEMFKQLEEHQAHFIDGTKDYQTVGKALAALKDQYDAIKDKEEEMANALKAGDTALAASLKAEIDQLNTAKQVMDTFDGTNLAKGVEGTIQSSKEGFQDLQKDLDALRAGTLGAEDSGRLMGNMSKVLMYLQEGTDEYNKLLEVMKEVYAQDMNIDRMQAMSAAIKENAELFSDDKEKYNQMLNLAAQLDARIKQVGNSWRDINIASDETLADMQKQYEGIVQQMKVVNKDVADMNDEERRSLAILDDAKQKLDEIKAIRSERAGNIIGDGENQATQDIQNSIRFLQEQLDKETLTVEKREEYNKKIAEGNALLAQRGQGDKMDQMDVQLGAQRPVDASTGKEMGREEYNRKLAEYADLERAAKDHYTTLEDLKKQHQQACDDFDRQQKAGVIDITLSNQITALKQALGQEELLFNDAKDQADDARKDIASSFANIANLSRNALNEQIKFWTGVKNNANSTAEDVVRAEERILAAQDALAQKGQTASDYYTQEGQLAPDKSRTVAETKEDIASMKELLDTMQTGSEEAKNLAEKIKNIQAILRTSTEGSVTTAGKDLYSLNDALDKVAQITYQAKDYVEELTGYEKMSAEELEKVKKSLVEGANKLDLSKAADRDTFIEAQKSIQDVDRALVAAKMHGVDFGDMVKNLDAKPLNELKYAAEQMKKRLEFMSENDDDRKKMLEDFRAITHQIEMMEEQTKNTQNAFEKAIDRIKTYVMVYMSFGKITDMLKGIFNQSLKLSDLMSDIRKRTQMAPDEIRYIGWSIDEMARSTRTAQEQLYNLGAAAGLLGLKGQDEVMGFVRAANEMNVALVELGADGATQLMKVATLTGDKQRFGVEEALKRVGSSINSLTAASAASAGPIVDFISRVGAVGSNAKMTMADIAGLGATLDALGQPAELSATSVNRFIMALKNNSLGIAASLGINPEQIQELLATGHTMEAMIITLEEMKKHGGDMSQIFGELGSEGVRLKQTMESLMGNTEMLREQVALSNKEFAKATSMTNEYNIKNENAAAMMERATNMWKSAFSPAENVDTWRGVAVIWEGITAIMTKSAKVLGTTISAAKVLAMIMVGITAQTALWSKELKGALANSTKLKALFATMKGMLSPRNLIGGVIGLVAGLGLEALFSWISKIKDAADAAKQQIKDMFAILNENVRKVDDRFNNLKRLRELGMQNTDTYKKLLKELNNEYGTYIGYTITEATSLSQLAAAQQLVNAGIREQIRLEQQKSKIAAIQEKYGKTEDDARAEMEVSAKKNAWGYVQGAQQGYEIKNSALRDTQMPLFNSVVEKAATTAFENGFAVNEDGEYTREMADKAVATLTDLLKQSGLYNDKNGKLKTEALNQKVGELKGSFLKYLKARYQENVETQNIFDTTQAAINQDAKDRVAATINSLRDLREEYNREKKEDVSKLSEEEQQKHYANMLRIQSDYQAMYNANMNIFNKKERTAISQHINDFKKEEANLRQLAGIMSQFGFENVEWSRMSGDELKKNSDELNKIWKFYSQNGDWQAFGNRVGQKFAAEQDAKKWIDEQVAAIADRADFLDITRPTGWQYPTKNKDKDKKEHIQELMDKWLKRLEDYYNQQKAAIRKNYEGIIGQEEAMERKLQLKDEEYKAARIGLELKFAGDMATLSEEQQKQYRLRTEREIAMIEERQARLRKVMDGGRLEDVSISDMTQQNRNDLSVYTKEKVTVAGTINQTQTEDLQKQVVDMFNADPSKVWDVAALRTEAQKQGGNIAKLVSSLKDAEAQKMVDELNKLRTRQSEAASKKQGSTTEQHLMDRLMTELNITAEQAAGMVGNFAVEAPGFNPKAENYKGNYGLAQWDTRRRKKFNDLYGKKIQQSTLDEQIDYIVYEMQGDYKYVLDRLRQTTTADEAAALIDLKYEVSEGTTRGKRKSYANTALQNYNNREDATPGAVRTIMGAGFLGEDLRKQLTIYEEKTEKEISVINNEQTAKLQDAFEEMINATAHDGAWTGADLLSVAQKSGGIVAEHLGKLKQAQLDAIAQRLNQLNEGLDMTSVQQEYASNAKLLNMSVGLEAYGFGPEFDRDIAIIQQQLALDDPKHESKLSKLLENTSSDLLDFRKSISEHFKEIHKIMLEGMPMQKVLDDFRANMTKLELLFTKEELLEGIDRLEGATERRMQIMQGFSAQISTMTFEEFEAQISATADFAGRTEMEYRVMYDKLLQLRDNYDDAARKKAKTDLKLLDNRIESGQYYKDQLSQLIKYQDELIRTGKTGTEAYMAVARAISVVQQRQNQLVNGKMTTFQQRQKQNLETANTRVKQEEAVKNSGVNNGVQLGQAKLRAASADFAIAMETYQVRQMEASAKVNEVLDKIDAAQKRLREAEGDAVKTQKALQELGALQSELQAAEAYSTELLGDAYDKMVEKQVAVAEQEAEIQKERLEGIKGYMETFNETISKYALAGIEARDAKAFELAELRAKKELGLVSDTTKQRFLIIKKSGEYEEKWLTQEEQIQEQIRIDAQNKRNEAIAEGLQNFAKKMSEQLRESLTRGMELDKQRTLEEQRQKVIQDVQKNSLNIQAIREMNMTSVMASEWEARLNYAKGYFNELNQMQSTGRVDVTKLSEYKSAGASAAFNNLNRYETGGIVPGTQTTGDNVVVRVNSREMILTQEQQAVLFRIANGELTRDDSAVAGLANELRLEMSELMGVVSSWQAQQTEINNYYDNSRQMDVNEGDRYTTFLQSCPDNIRYTDEKEYRMHRLWELNGKPENFDAAVEKGIFTLEADGFYHAPTVAYNASQNIYEFMKMPNHPTINYELDWYYSEDPEAINFRKDYILDRSGKFYKYLPIKEQEPLRKVVDKFEELPRFERGLENGMVPGNSTTGDKVLVRVNSGEVILTQQQARQLLEIANGNIKSGDKAFDNLAEYLKLTADGVLEVASAILKFSDNVVSTMQNEILNDIEYALRFNGDSKYREAYELVTSKLKTGDVTLSDDEIRIIEDTGEILHENIETIKGLQSIISSKSAAYINYTDGLGRNLIPSVETSHIRSSKTNDGEDGKQNVTLDIPTNNKVTNQTTVNNVDNSVDSHDTVTVINDSSTESVVNNESVQTTEIKESAPAPVVEVPATAPVAEAPIDINVTLDEGIAQASQPVAVITPKDWQNAFRDAFTQINLDDTIFTAISNAEDGLFDAEAWKSIGTALGLHIANATGAVLVSKMSEWMNNMYTNKVNREHAATEKVKELSGGKLQFDDVTSSKAHKAQNKSLKDSVSYAEENLKATQIAVERILKNNADNSELAVNAKDALKEAEVGDFMAKAYEKHFKEMRETYEKQLREHHNIIQAENKGATEQQVKDAQQAQEQMIADYDKLVTMAAMNKAAEDTANEFEGQTFEGGERKGQAVFDLRKYKEQLSNEATSMDIRQMEADGSWMQKLGVTNDDVAKAVEDMSPEQRAALDAEMQSRDYLAQIVSLLGGTPESESGETPETPEAESPETIDAPDIKTPETPETPSLDAPEGQMSTEEINNYAMAWVAAYETMGAAADEWLLKAMNGDKQLADDAKKQGQVMLKNKQDSDKKMTLAEQAKQSAIGTAQQVGAAAATSVGDMVAQASGSAMLGEITATLAKAGAEALIGIATGTAQSASQGWWMPAIVQPILTSLLMGALGAATSKAKSAQSTIASATGASVSAGKLTTGMLTYATGKYLDEGDGKNFKAKAGMLAFADGYNVGQTYNVDGADGHNYDGKYVGSVSDLGTGIQKGTHFGIFSEVKPEMVIDGDTTKLIHEKYPFLYNSILQVARTGMFNPAEMLSLDYNSIGKTIDTLTKSGALGGIPRMMGGGSFKMPTFAEGSYPYGDTPNMDAYEIDADGNPVTGNAVSQSQSNAMLQQTLQQLLETNAMMYDAFTTGKVRTTMSSKDFNKQKKFEQRMGIKGGLNG